MNQPSPAIRARRHYQLRDYLNRRVLTMLALGFASGLPFALIGVTFSYWLRDEKIALTAIATSIPAAPIWLPRRACAGCDR